MTLKQEILDLIAAMEAHRSAGGSPFDCPSLKAPNHIKLELQRGINAVFKQEMEKHKL
jgi:hypothetical protein